VSISCRNECVYETAARGEVALLDEDESRSLTADRAAKGADRHRLPCMGSHNGAKGMALFAKMDAVDLLSAAWWFDQAAGYRLPKALPGQCYFVTFREMLTPTSMDEFMSKDKLSWVVQDSDVSIFPPAQQHLPPQQEQLMQQLIQQQLMQQQQLIQQQQLMQQLTQLMQQHLPPQQTQLMQQLIQQHLPPQQTQLMQQHLPPQQTQLMHQDLPPQQTQQGRPQKGAARPASNPKGNAITPSVTVSRFSAASALSEGLTTGCSSLGGDSEASAEGGRGDLRVPGPSDRSRLPDSGRGSRNKTDGEKKAEAQQIAEVNDAWKGMKDSVGWTLKWDHTDDLRDNENFMTPYAGTIAGSIENLECFYTKAALMKHIDANPCLKYEWGLLWPMLQEAGWLHLGGTYLSSKGATEPGATSFRSKLAVAQFVARFPYPLQDDARLAQTLKDHGWEKRGKNFACDRSDRTGAPLITIRKKLWKSPSDLFVSSTIPRSRLQEAVILSKFVGLAEDREPDTPAKLVSPTTIPRSRLREAVMPSEFVGLAEDLEPDTPAKLGSALDAFVAGTSDWSEEVDEDTVAKFSTLLNDAGWKLNPGNTFNGNWWEYELLTIAPWVGIGKRKEKKPIIGSEAFWGLPDIFQYLKLHGTKKPENPVKPLDLILDYRKEEWTLNRRIQEIAFNYRTQFRGEMKKELFYGMLLSSGWRVLAPPKGISSDLMKGQLHVPYWNAGAVTLSTLCKFEVNHDYFAAEAELLKYLGRNGNVHVKSTPSRGASRTPERGSQSSYQLGNDATSATAYSPQSPRLRGDDPGNMLSSLMSDFRELEDSQGRFPHFTAIWNHLKTDGWKYMSTTGNATSEAVHVPPWSAHFTISVKSKVDVSFLVKDRDYFEAQQDVWRYLKKYGNAPTNNEPTQRELVRGARQANADPLPWPDRAGKRARAEERGYSPNNEKKSRKLGLGPVTAEEEDMCIQSDAEGEDGDDTDEGDEGDEEEGEESDEDAGDSDDGGAAAPVRMCEPFTPDYMTLLDVATQRDALDLRNTAEVVKFLNVKNRLREVTVKQGELDTTYYHRVDAWMKRTTLPARDLLPYKENWDYFKDHKAFGEFVRTQFAVRGHRSLKRAALRDDRQEQGQDDEFHIRYNPHDVGEVNAPHHAIAEHLAELGSAGSPY